MTYQDFLFSQLFMNHIETKTTKYQDLEYDILYPEVVEHQELFLNSNFNDASQSDYDCILAYLTNQIY